MGKAKGRVHAQRISGTDASTTGFALMLFMSDDGFDDL
jgi:hypothetical protein